MARGIFQDGTERYGLEKGNKNTDKRSSDRDAEEGCPRSFWNSGNSTTLLWSWLSGICWWFTQEVSTVAVFIFHVYLRPRRKEKKRGLTGSPALYALPVRQRQCWPCYFLRALQGARVLLRHTSRHLPAVSEIPQSFKSAQPVMRADRKRWNSSTSPPTHTHTHTGSTSSTHHLHLQPVIHNNTSVCVFPCLMQSHLRTPPTSHLFFFIPFFYSSDPVCHTRLLPCVATITLKK